MGQSSLMMNLFASFLPALVLTAVCGVGFAVFCGRVLLRGMPQTTRIMQEGKSIFLGKIFMEYWTWFIRPIVWLSVRVRVNPDVLTVIGCIVGAASGLAYLTGSFVAGGWLILLAGTFDILDGTVARRRGIVSKSGAFLDSTLDRYSELFAFSGLCVYYEGTGFTMVVFLAIAGSMMVSYTRARAEGLGVDVRVGNMQRTERVLYLGLGTAFAPIVSAVFEPGVVKPMYPLAMIAIGIIAVFSNTTALRRLLHTYRVLRERQGQTAAATEEKVVP